MVTHLICEVDEALSAAPLKTANHINFFLSTGYFLDKGASSSLRGRSDIGDPGRARGKIRSKSPLEGGSPAPVLGGPNPLVCSAVSTPRQHALEGSPTGDTGVAHIEQRSAGGAGIQRWKSGAPPQEQTLIFPC